MKKLSIVLVTILLLFACDNSSNEKGQSRFQQPYKSMLVYPKKNPIAEFSLSDHKMKPFDISSFKGRWNLIFMGYTNCPDVCPNTLTDITNIYKKLTPESQKKIQVVFLSVDPARDNLEHIGKYLDYFNDDFVGVTGAVGEIDKLVTSLGGIYSLNKEEGEYYSVDHSARIFIVSPEGERFGIIRSETMKSNKDTATLIKELNQLSLSS